MGALIHAGVPLAYLSEQLERLGISQEYSLQAERVHRNGQQATKMHVRLSAQVSDQASSAPDEAGVDPHTTFARHLHSTDGGSAASEQHGHGESHTHTLSHSHAEPPDAARHLPEIERLITAAHLPPRAEAWSLAVFRRLAEAEAVVHGIPPDQVHFHEVGAIDAVVDIVGTCLGFDWLGIDQLYCSPLPTGGGIVRAAHGQLPVPAPAVLKLWEMRQVPIYSNGIQRELVTPTGAAIVTTLAVRFGAPPPLTLHQVGLGAGSRDLPIPNILRLWLGEGEGTHNKPDLQPASLNIQPSQEPIVLLETQIDDLNPQAIGYVFEALFAAGAVDVFTQAIGMKKSRPGVLLSVVCHPPDVQACEAVLFRETTTLGIRHTRQQRTILPREFQTVQTPYGAVRIKVARSPANHQILNAQPEYEDCATIARQTHQPWRDVHRLALQAWYAQLDRSGNPISGSPTARGTMQP